MIRKYKTCDLDVIMEIWLVGNIEGHPFIEADYWKKHFGEVKNMLPQSEIYVYEDQGAVQGFAGVQENYIAGVFVGSGKRSNGIGTQLLSAVKAEKDHLTLQVYEKNNRAISFYQREGFVVLSQQMDCDTGETEYLMQWKRSGEK